MALFFFWFPLFMQPPVRMFPGSYFQPRRNPFQFLALEIRQVAHPPVLKAKLPVQR